MRGGGVFCRAYIYNPGILRCAIIWKDRIKRSKEDFSNVQIVRGNISVCNSSDKTKLLIDPIFFEDGHTVMLDDFFIISDLE